ncbi:NAD(P)/FAD-dependent oxidoreductase [Chloroflexus sp.]|uniref:NAD(P)/FAD-dependent oxidoreductase n=1 Tax=Chloroflexus sp. TaxID=1904827 RepID=UPI002ADE42C9|nr:NAD(P)/FAD-dependent oxidoreductase [Chloroflexus sp.]
MRIAIVGAGIAGLSAAYDLAGQGYAVTIYEAGDQVGGLASGFRDTDWDWPLERFYHHIFTTDHAIIKLTNEIGMRDRLFFRAPITAQWWQGKGYALDGVLPVLRFPGLPFIDRLRFGLTAFYLKFITQNWQRLEQTTAMAWTERVSGRNVARVIWRPLLEGKFGPHADEVNMAWLWARLRARSFQLGYFRGGFQAFADELCAACIKRGVQVWRQTPVQAVYQTTTGWQISAAQHPPADYDTVLVTGAPGLLARLVTTLPAEYLGQLRRLNSMGAVVMTIALRRPLTNGIYWLNLPKDEFPFLALVEHTNFIEPDYYGGDHLIYCGDYLDPNHEYFRLDASALLERFLPALSQINPAFQPEWVRAYWLHRETYAQPIVPINHSRNIPPIATPLPGLFWASMSQVYPWDRGTNYAVELGRRAAQVMHEFAGQYQQTVPLDY